MNYYDVIVGAEKHWDSSAFTYSYDGSLQIGQLVNVPFGKKNKTGIVVALVKKPRFKTRELTPHSLIASDETRAFMQWYRQFYAAQPGQVHAQFLPHYLTKKLPKVPKPPTREISTSPRLTRAQKDAVNALKNTQKPSVLHGITGSGKTRIYISLLLDTLQNGRSALLLYPEISLTTQLLSEVRKYADVVAFHSQMTNAERSKLWFRIASSRIPIVVMGPRSALFLPYKNLGLIIIDEAHESSYKQENDVRYNGIMAAGGLAKAHEAKLIIGSATPPLAETELILKSGGELVCIHQKAIASDYSTTVAVIDKKNRRAFTHHPLLSDVLISAISEDVSDKKQVLLFINRRGTAKLTLCESCGWQAECPHCELPMTFHHDTHKLVCHTCGAQSPVPALCLQCESPTKLKALGSKAVVEEVARLFPDARIARFDTDTEKGASFAERYDEIHSGGVDILIGTQQIVKGLDLPLLRTVGVIDADLSLHFPDYTSDERTFQLLSQVAGRVGRGHGEGRIFVQTLHPESAVIMHAQTEDWHAFRDKELENRRLHNFSPYIYSVKAIFRSKKYNDAFQKAQAEKERISLSPDVHVDGPLPSFIAKRGGHFYVQLHAHATSRLALLKALRGVSSDVILDLDPATLL